MNIFPVNVKQNSKNGKTVEGNNGGNLEDANPAIASPEELIKKVITCYAAPKFGEKVYAFFNKLIQDFDSVSFWRDSEIEEMANLALQLMKSCEKEKISPEDLKPAEEMLEVIQKASDWEQERTIGETSFREFLKSNIANEEVSKGLCRFFFQTENLIWKQSFVRCVHETLRLPSSQENAFAERCFNWILDLYSSGKYTPNEILLAWHKALDLERIQIARCRADLSIKKLLGKFDKPLTRKELRTLFLDFCLISIYSEDSPFRKADCMSLVYRVLQLDEFAWKRASEPQKNIIKDVLLCLYKSSEKVSNVYELIMGELNCFFLEKVTMLKKAGIYTEFSTLVQQIRDSKLVKNLVDGGQKERIDSLIEATELMARKNELAATKILEEICAAVTCPTVVNPSKRSKKIDSILDHWEISLQNTDRCLQENLEMLLNGIGYYFNGTDFQKDIEMLVRDTRFLMVENSDPGAQFVSGFFGIIFHLLVSSIFLKGTVKYDSDLEMILAIWAGCIKKGKEKFACRKKENINMEEFGEKTISEIIIFVGGLADNQQWLNELKKRPPLDREILSLLADINSIFSLFASQDDQIFINEWEEDVFILSENFLPKRDGVNASTYCLKQLLAHIFSPEQMVLVETGKSGQWLKNIREKAEEIIHDVTCELNEEGRVIKVMRPVTFSKKPIKNVKNGVSIMERKSRNETASAGIIKNQPTLNYYDFFSEVSRFYEKISESSLSQIFNIVRLESLSKVIAFRKILEAQDGDIMQLQKKPLKQKSVEQFLHLFYYTYVREEIDEKLGLATDEKEVFLFLDNLLTIIGDEGLKEYFASQQRKTFFGGNVMELENACASPKENLRNWFRVSMPGTDPMIAEKKLIENLLDWAKDLIRRKLKSVCWERRDNALDCFGVVMFLRKEYAAIAERPMKKRVNFSAGKW